MTITSERAKSTTVKRSEPHALTFVAGLIADSDETATFGVVVDIEFLFYGTKTLRLKN